MFCGLSLHSSPKLLDLLHYSTLPVLTRLLNQSTVGPFYSKTKVGCLLSLLLFCSFYFAPRDMCSPSQLWALWKLWRICVLCLLLNPGHDQEEFRPCWAYGLLSHCGLVCSFKCCCCYSHISRLLQGQTLEVVSCPQGIQEASVRNSGPCCFLCMDLFLPATTLPTKAVRLKSWSLVLCLMQMASSRPMVPALVAYEDLLRAFKQF